LIYPNYVKLGTANSTDILVDLSRLEDGHIGRVQLAYAYTTVRPAGMPTRPSMTGTAILGMDFPQTIPAGTALSCLQAEADALVAAGVATSLGPLTTESGIVITTETGTPIGTEST
jgi:hypothetical protein